MALSLSLPSQPPSLDDCLRAARFEEIDVAETMSLTAARHLMRMGGCAQAAALLSAVERMLPTYEAPTLRDLLADLLEDLGELEGALVQAGIVDGQLATAASALRVGRLKLAVGDVVGARHDLMRTREWAHMMGDLEVAKAVGALLASGAPGSDSASSSTGGGGGAADAQLHNDARATAASL